MCLKVFLSGDSEKYEELKPYAMRLGAAFQKINFLKNVRAPSTYNYNLIIFPQSGPALQGCTVNVPVPKAVSS